MTAPSRITQRDIERATKVAAKLERARVVLDLPNGRIEIIIGDIPAPAPEADEWSDDDV